MSGLFLIQASSFYCSNLYMSIAIPKKAQVRPQKHQMTRTITEGEKKSNFFTLDSNQFKGPKIFSSIGSNFSPDTHR